MTATERLRQLLDERGVKWWKPSKDNERWTHWRNDDDILFTASEDARGCVWLGCTLTPEQVVEATLGRVAWSSPTWERWHQSLKHESVNTIGDAVEQLMYEAIEFGGDMGPNGNVYQGIDEGDVLTSGFINSWIERFEELGRGTCHDADVGSYFVCSECEALIKLHSIGRSYVDEWGKRWYATSNDHGFNYCPNCGRRVTEVVE